MFIQSVSTDQRIRDSETPRIREQPKMADNERETSKRDIFCKKCHEEGTHAEGCVAMFTLPTSVEYTVIPGVGEVIQSANLVGKVITNEGDQWAEKSFQSPVLSSFRRARMLGQDINPFDGSRTRYFWEPDVATGSTAATGSTDASNTDDGGHDVDLRFVNTERRGAGTTRRFGETLATSPNMHSTPYVSSANRLRGNREDDTSTSAADRSFEALRDITEQMGRMFTSTMEKLSTNVANTSAGSSSFAVQRFELDQKSKRKCNAERDVPEFSLNASDRSNSDARALKFRNWKSKMLQLTEHTNDEKLVVLKRKLGADENMFIDQCEDGVREDFKRLLGELTKRYDPANDPLQAARVFHGTKQKPGEMLDMFNIRFGRAMHPMNYTMSSNDPMLIQIYIGALLNISTRKRCHDRVSELSTAGKEATVKDMVICADNHERSSMAAAGRDADGNQILEVSTVDVGSDVPLEPYNEDDYEVNVIGGQQRGGRPGRPQGREYRPNNGRDRAPTRADGRPVARRGFITSWDDNRNCIIHRSNGHALVDCSSKNRGDCIRCLQDVVPGKLAEHLRGQCKAVKCFNCRKWGTHMAKDCPEPQRERFESGRTAEKRSPVSTTDDSTTAKKSVE